MCEAREQRGKAIADTCTILKQGKLWRVPSQSGNGTYSVSVEREFCTCPDHCETGSVCKHMHAVRLTLTKTAVNANGVETTETLTVERKTYRQDWTNYNRAQVNEHRVFQALLSDLCRTIPVPAPKPGKPPINPQVAAFTAILKVYSTMSARRFVGDLDEAFDRGHISHVPHFNSVLKFFDRADATDILQGFVQQSAAPLAAVETQFAVDSTGFAGARYCRWIDEKYGTPKSEVAWVKLHAMIGVKTNVITSCEVLDKRTPDSPELPGLVAETAKTFTVDEVSADKAYCGRENFAAVESVGGKFYPAFKKNATGQVGGAYRKAYHLFAMNAEEYGRHYHMRSNVESTFSAVKRVFGENLRSKSDRAMKNEVLAKVVCHNIRCLIAAMYELNLTPLLGMESCTQTENAAHILPMVRA